MTYTPNVPLTGQFLGNTRASINTNFQQINVWSGVDHFAYNTTNAGKHKFVRMPVRTTVAPTASGELSIFTKTASSESNLYYVADNKPASIYQLSRTNDGEFATFGGSPKGWTFLPGGLYLMYGSQANAGTGIQAVTFPFSFTSTPYSIQITGQTTGSSNSISLDTTTPPTSAGFSYKTSASAGTIYWIAIGK